MSTLQPKSRPWFTPLVVAITIALLLGACGFNGDDASVGDASAIDSPTGNDSPAGNDGAPQSATAEVVAEGEAGSGSGRAESDLAVGPDAGVSAPGIPGAPPGGAATDPGSGISAADPLTPIDLGRDIIFTAEITVEVDDVNQAGRQALIAVERVGGILFGQQTTTDGQVRTSLTFKVPPAQFQAVVTELGTVGLLRDQNISATDVTERVVDLESRIITAQASVDRLRGFLENAASLSEVASLESELLRRETDLELLRGQLRSVQAMVDLATITVHLSERLPGPEVVLETSFYAGHDAGVACPASRELRLDEGDAVTVCFVVINTGDTFLDTIVLTDPAFGIRGDAVKAVGDVALLAPGERAHYWAEVTAVDTRASQSRVSARPVDDQGVELRLPLAIGAGEARLEVEPDTSLPGFVEGLAVGWRVLTTIVAAVVVTVGFLLPLIWIPALLIGLMVWLRRRRVATRPAGTSVAPGGEPAAVSDVPPPPASDAIPVAAPASRVE